MVTDVLTCVMLKFFRPERATRYKFTHNSVTFCLSTGMSDFQFDIMPPQEISHGWFSPRRSSRFWRQSNEGEIP